MRYVKDFDFFGDDIRQVPCLTGKGAPASATAVEAGILYMDTNTGTMYKCTAAGVWEVVAHTAPRNMLDNSWFANPVNQRGMSSYNGAGYTIDRWRVSNQYATVNVNSGYVEFKASGGTAIPRQIISTNADMFGKTYTAAVCTSDGVVRTVSGTLTAEATGTETTFASGTIFTGVVLRIVKSPDVSTISFRIDLSDGRSLALKWAALYEGEYTAETLPHYVHKGYGTELMNCQQRFHVYETESARPSKPLDCCPTMILAPGTTVLSQGTFTTSDGKTLYYNSSDL